MNKIVLDKEEVITLEEDLEILVPEGYTKEIYILGERNKYQLRYVLEKNSLLTVHHCSIDASFHIEVELKEENAKINYFYSMINYHSQSLKFLIFHKASKTSSNIINHGVNVENDKLLFDINPKVEKRAELCVCNQENSIINLKDGESIIRPNLLIDNYNVISNHSAYIGTFSKEQLFYMMSRGLSREVSYELLMRYFLVQDAGTIKEKIPKFLEEIQKL